MDNSAANVKICHGHVRYKTVWKYMSCVVLAMQGKYMCICTYNWEETLVPTLAIKCEEWISLKLYITCSLWALPLKSKTVANTPNIS